MLTIQSKAMFRLRGIANPYGWMLKNGLSPTTARKVVSGDYRNVSMDVLETLCVLLRCTPNELMAWQPRGGVADATHPLAALQEKEHKNLENIVAGLNEMSVAQLQELGRKMEEVRKGSE